MSWSRRGMLKRAGIVAGALSMALLLSAWSRPAGRDRWIGVTTDIVVPPPKPKPPIPVLPPAPPAAPSNWFVITSDPQYPWTPHMDGTGPATSDEEAFSRQLIEEQYDSINRFAAGRNVAGTFINGDLTAFGHRFQIDYMKGALARLKQPVYLGLGNHDYQNNVNDCSDNWCMRQSVYWFLEHMESKSLEAFDVSKRRYFNFPHNIEEVYGSLGWRKSFGGITVIQLNNHASYTAWGSGYAGHRGLGEHINIRPAFRWLEAQLAWARERGQAIVLMMHKPNVGEIAALAKQYEVDAIFAGHYHGSIECRLDTSINAPLCFSGAASQRTYLVLEDVGGHGYELKIHRVRDNNPESRELIYTAVPKRNVYRNPWGTFTSKYPFEVRVQNQGGFEAGFWASYSLGGRNHYMEAYRQTGSGHVFTFPAGARNARIHAAAYTGVAWKKWDDIFVNHPSPFQDHCYVVWGSTFHNDSGNC